MGDFLKKEQVLFDRNEKGELLPITIELSELKGSPKVSLIPISKGKFQKINADKNAGTLSETLDVDLILEHCVNPKFSREELDGNAIKFNVVNAIVNALIALSTGQSQEEIKKLSADTVTEHMKDYLEKK